MGWIEFAALLATAVLFGVCLVAVLALNHVGIRELRKMPGRWRAWRKAGRTWRKQAPTLPPAEPGTEAAEALAYFRKLRRAA